MLGKKVSNWIHISKFTYIISLLPVKFFLKMSFSSHEPHISRISYYFMNIYDRCMNFTYLYSQGGVSHAKVQNINRLIAYAKQVYNLVKPNEVITITLPVPQWYTRPCVLCFRSGFTKQFFNHLPHVGEGKDSDDWKGVDSWRYQDISI